jgi:hypothetical protein
VIVVKSISKNKDKTAIVELAEFIKVNQRIPFEHRQVAKNWFEIAKVDLDAAQILYNKSMIPFTIYHLQQAYEKMSKAFFILNGNVKGEDVYGHDFSSRLVRSCLENQIWPIISKIPEFDPKFEIEKKKEIWKQFNNKQIIRTFEYSKINELIKIFLEYDNIIRSNKFLEKIYKEVNCPQKLRALKHIIFKITRFRVRTQDVKDKTTRDEIEKGLFRLSLSTRVIVFSVLFQYHSNTSRYPNDKKSDMNYFSYTNELGIVKFIPEALELTTKIINDFDKFIQLELKNKDN